MVSPNCTQTSSVFPRTCLGAMQSRLVEISELPKALHCHPQLSSADATLCAMLGPQRPQKALSSPFLCPALLPFQSLFSPSQAAGPARCQAPVPGLGATEKTTSPSPGTTPSLGRGKDRASVVLQIIAKVHRGPQVPGSVIYTYT